VPDALTNIPADERAEFQRGMEAGVKYNAEESAKQAI
jgi:hypothetical protein